MQRAEFVWVFLARGEGDFNRRAPSQKSARAASSCTLMWHVRVNIKLPRDINLAYTAGVGALAPRGVRIRYNARGPIGTYMRAYGLSLVGSIS